MTLTVKYDPNFHFMYSMHIRNENQNRLIKILSEKTIVYLKKKRNLLKFMHKFIHSVPSTLKNFYCTCSS